MVQKCTKTRHFSTENWKIFRRRGTAPFPGPSPGWVRATPHTRPEVPSYIRILATPVEGCVDLGGWLHAEMVYLPAVTGSHPSKY